MWSFIAAFLATVSWGGVSVYQQGNKIIEDKVNAKRKKTNWVLQDYYMQQAEYAVWTDAIKLTSEGWSGDDIKKALFNKYNVPIPNNAEFLIKSKNADQRYSIDGLALSITQRHMKELGYQYKPSIEPSQIFFQPTELQEKIKATKFFHGWK